MEEIKVNKDIADYEENLFFGLTARQTLWGLIALGAAALGFIIVKPRFGDMAAGLVAVICAAPFGAMAFFRWHNLSAFQAARKIIRSVLAPRYLLFRASTVYLEDYRRHGSGTKSKEKKTGKEKEKRK